MPSAATGHPPCEWHWAAARDEFQKALDEGYGTTFSSTVLRGWQRDTLKGYLRHIKRLARAERMRPGDGPRTVLESRLLAIAQADQSESLAKAVLSAARVAEKMAWMPTVVRASDWNLVVAIELQRSKEERAAAKEWAPWGPGAANGYSSWSNSRPARHSTPTRGLGTGLETRWVRP